MKVIFRTLSGLGIAEYDSSNGEYWWDYNGNDEEIIEAISQLDDGRMYHSIDTDDPSYPDEDGPEVTEERYSPLPWDDQISELASTLEDRGAQIQYLGE